MMRIFVKLFAILLMAMSAGAFTADADALRRAVASGDPTQINQTLVQLHSALATHKLVDDSSWDNPSPERRQRQREITSALEPIKSELVELSRHEDRTVASNASMLLGYSAGGDAVYQALKDNLQTKYPSLAVTGLYSLYQIGRADDTVRLIAAQRIAKYQSSGESKVAFDLLNLAAIWPLPEALPVCIEMLKSEVGTAAKVAAAKAVMKLGPAAEEALPELQRFLAQLRAQGGDFRDINTLERAVRVVSGQTEPQVPAMSIASATPTPATPVPTATPTASPAPTTPLAPVLAAPSERRAPMWPWLVGIAAVAVIALLVWKRRA